MTKYKVQNLRSLREEMKAVGRGEQPAPASISRRFENLYQMIRIRIAGYCGDLVYARQCEVFAERGVELSCVQWKTGRVLYLTDLDCAPARICANL